jgi:hypothetical protein
MCKPLLALVTGTLLFMSLAATAENSTAVGGYVIHHNAFTTDTLSPQVANAYGIRRSKERAMLNISIIRGEPGKLGNPVAAQVKATARNIIGQQRDIPLREIREGDAIYYIGDFPVAHKEKLDFFLEATPDGEHQPLKARLNQVFYTD